MSAMLVRLAMSAPDLIRVREVCTVLWYCVNQMCAIQEMMSDISKNVPTHVRKCTKIYKHQEVCRRILRVLSNACQTSVCLA